MRHSQPDWSAGTLAGSSANGVVTMSAPLFPVFLKLDGRSVLVVGGGPVAEAKTKSLLEAGAQVTLVAPEIHFRLDQRWQLLIAYMVHP